MAGPTTSRASTRASTGQYVLCGALQLLVFLAYASVAGIVFSVGYDWISAGSGRLTCTCGRGRGRRADFAGMCVLPIVAKWTLIGRWKRKRSRSGAARYFRFWLVSTLIRANPMILFAGSPLYPLYLRALGAKIGRGRRDPLPARARVHRPAHHRRRHGDPQGLFFNCYRAEAGVIRTGTVTIGADAFVGQATVLDIDTSLGDGAQLGHASSLYEGQAVPAGERRQGSPAEQRTEADHRRSNRRRRRRPQERHLRRRGAQTLLLSTCRWRSAAVPAVPPSPAVRRALRVVAG